MSVMAWLLVGLIIVPISAMIFSLIAVDRGGLAAVRGNLGRGLRLAQESTPTAESRGPAGLGIRMTPKGYAGWLDKLLAKAGRPAGMPRIVSSLRSRPCLGGGIRQHAVPESRAGFFW